MASFTGKANGNWSATGQTTWNESGTPAAGDTVDMGAYTITMDIATIPAGGGTLASLDAAGAAGYLAVPLDSATFHSGAAIKATVIGAGTATNTTGLIQVTGSTDHVLTITGNVIANTIGSGVYHNSTGTVYIVGNVTGGSGATGYGAQNLSSGTLDIDGNILSGATQTSYGVYANGASSKTYIHGDITGHATVANTAVAYLVGAAAIFTQDGGTITGGGASSAVAIRTVTGSDMSLTINGAITGGSYSSGYGMSLDTASATVVIGTTGSPVEVTAATGVAISITSSSTDIDFTLHGSVVGAAGIGIQTSHPSGTVLIDTGTITGGTTASKYGVSCLGAGAVTLGTTANPITIVGGSNTTSHGVNVNHVDCVLTVVGNVSGGTSTGTARGIYNNTASVINITGNVTGGSGTIGSCAGIYNGSTGVVTVTGNLIDSTTNVAYNGAPIVWTPANPVGGVVAGNYHQVGTGGGAVKAAKILAAGLIVDGQWLGDTEGTRIDCPVAQAQYTGTPYYGNPSALVDGEYPNAAQIAAAMWDDDTSPDRTVTA